MGGLYYDMDLHDSAYICYSTALKLAREQNNKEMESVVACQLARYYNLQGMEISQPKSQKIYIERRNMSNGEVISRVVVNK